MSAFMVVINHHTAVSEAATLGGLWQSCRDAIVEMTIFNVVFTVFTVTCDME